MNPDGEVAPRSRRDLAEICRLISQDGATQVAVSRAASPEFRHAVSQIVDVVEAPVVRGRAVWEAVPPATAIVEQPNWWGRLEDVPSGSIVLDRRSAPDQAQQWRMRVDLSRHLGRNLNQLSGVQLAHGNPEAPWFVLLLPIPGETAVAALADRNVTGVVAIDRSYAELPGGVRIEPPMTSPGLWQETCVASLAEVITRTVGKDRGSP